MGPAPSPPSPRGPSAGGREAQRPRRLTRPESKQPPLHAQSARGAEGGGLKPARGSAGSGFFEKIRRAASNPALAAGPASVGVGEAVLLNGAGAGHKKAASVPGSPKHRPIAGKGKKAD